MCSYYLFNVLAAQSNCSSKAESNGTIKFRDMDTLKPIFKNSKTPKLRIAYSRFHSPMYVPRIAETDKNSKTSEPKRRLT